MNCQLVNVMNINEVCYCGFVLKKESIKSNKDWICHSCFKYISKDVTTQYICTNTSCIYKTQNQICRMCGECCHHDALRSNVLNIMNNDDKSVIYQKCYCSLQTISYVRNMHNKI